ncbi:MAG: hypothetical protein O9341_08630 [Paucibacter sp.]|nr:hypothetical protein [Roseateles sp.]
MAQPQLVSSTLHRTFETASDRRANQTVGRGPLQRSYSWRSLYTDGSVVREHVHDNARSGGNQFQHVIGGFNPDGTRWGRNDPWNG